MRIASFTYWAVQKRGPSRDKRKIAFSERYGSVFPKLEAGKQSIDVVDGDYCVNDSGESAVRIVQSAPECDEARLYDPSD